MAKMQVNILQIMPPGGWQADFANTREPLVAWALVQQGSDRPFVTGIVTDPKGAETAFAEDREDFSAYLHYSPK